MSHHAQWVSMDTVPLKKNEVCCEESVYSTKVFCVTSPVTMITMFLGAACGSPYIVFKLAFSYSFM